MNAQKLKRQWFHKDYSLSLTQHTRCKHSQHNYIAEKKDNCKIAQYDHIEKRSERSTNNKSDKSFLGTLKIDGRHSAALYNQKTAAEQVWENNLVFFRSLHKQKTDSEKIFISQIETCQDKPHKASDSKQPKARIWMSLPTTLGNLETSFVRELLKPASEASIWRTVAPILTIRLGKREVGSALTNCFYIMHFQEKLVFLQN